MYEYIPVDYQVSQAADNLGNSLSSIADAILRLIYTMLDMLFTIVNYCVSNPFLVIVIAICFMYWCRKRYKVDSNKHDHKK